MTFSIPHSHDDTAVVYRNTDWSAAIWSALIAGVVFMVLQMALVTLVKGQSPRRALRMTAAMALGKDVLSPPANFNAKAVMTAIMIHLLASIIFAFVTDWIVHKMNAGIAVAMGAFIGLVIYVVHFYLIAPAFFPWFIQAQGWITAFDHIVFGIVLAGAYVALRKKQCSARVRPPRS